MDEFTDALIVALRAGADDPDRNAMGSRMKALVGELTKKEVSKANKAVAPKKTCQTERSLSFKLPRSAAASIQNS